VSGNPTTKPETGTFLFVYRTFRGQKRGIFEIFPEFLSIPKSILIHFRASFDGEGGGTYNAALHEDQNRPSQRL
jgi:hypothetical protein